MSLYRTGRKLRVSALHPKLQAAGAIYGEVLGYERPLFYNADEVTKSKRKIFETISQRFSTFFVFKIRTI